MIARFPLRTRGLLGLAEHRRRLVENQKPAALLVFEYVRYECIEGDDFAIFA
jgi:hypothetical protein